MDMDLKYTSREVAKMIGVSYEQGLRILRLPALRSHFPEPETIKIGRLEGFVFPKSEIDLIIAKYRDVHRSDEAAIATFRRMFNAPKKPSGAVAHRAAYSTTVRATLEAVLVKLDEILKRLS